jgi:hypothetical protein
MWWLMKVKNKWLHKCWRKWKIKGNFNFSSEITFVVLYSTNRDIGSTVQHEPWHWQYCTVWTVTFAVLYSMNRDIGSTVQHEPCPIYSLFVSIVFWIMMYQVLWCFALNMALQWSNSAKNKVVWSIFFCLRNLETISICVSTKYRLFQYTSSFYCFKLTLWVLCYWFESSVWCQDLECGELIFTPLDVAWWPTW